MPKDKEKIKEENTLELSVRFLSARPDLVGVWIAGARDFLQLFKTAHIEVIAAYLHTVEINFFGGLKRHCERKYPDQKFEYSLGTICRNSKNEERFIVGIRTEKNGKPTYEYIFGETMGACNESSMKSWMEK